MRSACAIGFGLVFLFAGGLAHAQRAAPPGKLAPTTPAVNKATCEKSGAKIGTAAPTVKKADRFAALDLNKDGKLDPTEFKGGKRAFAWVDTDHNGTISRPEARRAYLTIVGGMAIAERVKAYKAMDENRDGKISLAEYKGPAATFARIDLNHDGVITREEGRKAFRASLGRYVIATRFRSLDANHDGMLSATEFKGPKAAFARFDRDKNGLIGPVEFAKMIQARAAARKLAMAKPIPTPVKPVAAVVKTNAVKPIKTSPAQKPVKPAAAKKVATATPIPATAKPVAVVTIYSWPVVGAPTAIPTSVKPAVVVTKTKAVKPIKTSPALKPIKSAAKVTRLNRILAMDANKDGKVGMGEYFKAVEARFLRLDQDKDGYITAGDLAKVAALTKSKATPKPVAAPAVKPPLKSASLKPAKPAAVKPVKATKPVAATGAVSRPKVDVVFDQIDVNHDGVLTRTEVKVYLAKQPPKSPTKTTATHKG